MDLDVIRDRLPSEILRLIASYSFRPLYKCHLCQEIFGYTGKHCYYSLPRNLAGTRRAQPVPVLFLSYNSRHHTHCVVDRRVYCTRCITAHGFQHFIDPIIELTFFSKEQIVVIDNTCSSFHDYHVLVCDWPEGDKPYQNAKHVLDCMRMRKKVLYRGFCMYTARVSGADVARVLNNNYRPPITHLFEKGYLHFFGNEKCRFSDMFMNLRLINCKQSCFSFWVEAELIEAMQIQTYPSSQAKVVKNFYLSSDYVEAWTIERIRLSWPLFEYTSLQDYRLEVNGDLYHVPTHTIWTPASIYILPPDDGDLFMFIRQLHAAHPGEDSNPYHFNSDLYAPTDSDTTDEDEMEFLNHLRMGNRRPQIL